MAEMDREVFKFPDEIEDQGKPVDTEESKGKPLEAGAFDELEIEVEDDTPVEDQGRKPADPEQVKKLRLKLMTQTNTVKKLKTSLLR